MFGKKRLAEADFFPRKWEYTRLFFLLIMIDRLFPTQVGVALNYNKKAPSIIAFSHTSGSNPISFDEDTNTLLFFPREWE